MKLLQVLSYNVKRRRGVLSQEQVAKMSGVDISVIRSIEQARSLPGLANIEKLAEFFMVEAAELFAHPNRQPHDIEDCYRAIGEALNLIEEEPIK